MSRPHGGLGSDLAAHLAWQVSLLPPDPNTVPHSHLDGSGRAPPWLWPTCVLGPGSDPPAAGDGMRGKKKQRREST